MADEEKKNTDDFPTEEDVIPASVLEVMEKVDTEIKEAEVTEKAELEAEETETKETETKTETEVSETEITNTETETEAKETKTEGEDDTEPIPQEQINIARRLGWSDEYIVQVAENNPEILEDMVTLAGRNIQQSQVKQTQETAPEKKQEEVKGLEKIKLDDEALKKMRETYGEDVVNQAILPLATGLNSAIDKINALGSSVSGAEKASKEKQAIKDFDEANTVFDSLSETFEVFGKTKDLPKLADGSYDKNSPAVQERVQVYDVAMSFRGSGKSWTDALKNAVRWYKGENAEKSLERKIVKDINSRKKKFSPRPTSKKTAQAFATREDEGVELVRKAFKN